MRHRPPNWKNLGRSVAVSAALGLGIAICIFFVLRQWLFPQDSKIADVISSTATALGALTIGGVAVIQFRKHKFLEFDEDARMGERLRGAVEHLGHSDMHIRIGAIYEFERLSEDSPRDRERIAKILTRFLESKQGELKESEKLPLDVSTAADVLQALVRQEIEGTKGRRWGWQPTRPKHFVFDALELLTSLPGDKPAWQRLKAKGLCFDWAKLSKVNLIDAHLKNSTFSVAHLEDVLLCGAHLEGANLRGAYLKGANLRHAYMRGSMLRDANLAGADLRTVRLKGAKGLNKTQIDSHTKFSPGVREKYFPDFKEDPEETSKNQ